MLATEDAATLLLVRVPNFDQQKLAVPDSPSFASLDTVLACNCKAETDFYNGGCVLAHGRACSNAGLQGVIPAAPNFQEVIKLAKVPDFLDAGQSRTLQASLWSIKRLRSMTRMR
jgi:hypothetical protein